MFPLLSTLRVNERFLLEKHLFPHFDNFRDIIALRSSCCLFYNNIFLISYQDKLLEKEIASVEDWRRLNDVFAKTRLTRKGKKYLINNRYFSLSEEYIVQQWLTKVSFSSNYNWRILKEILFIGNKYIITSFSSDKKKLQFNVIIDNILLSVVLPSEYPMIVPEIFRTEKLERTGKLEKTLFEINNNYRFTFVDGHLSFNKWSLQLTIREILDNISCK